MEPITLIVTALVAGASAAAKDTAGQAIKDAYQGLKAMIQKRFAGKPEAESVLAKHEEKPQVWGEPLKEALDQAGVAKDEDILKAAQELLERADPDGAARGKYNVYFEGLVQGSVIGDRATVTQTFGNNIDDSQKKHGSS